MKLWDDLRYLFRKITGAKTADLRHVNIQQEMERTRENRPRRPGQRPWKDRQGGRGQGPRGQGARGEGSRGGFDRGAPRFQDRGRGRDQSSGSRDNRGERTGGGGYSRDRGRGRGGYNRGSGGPGGGSGSSRPWHDRQNHQVRRDRPASPSEARQAPEAPKGPREERKFLVGTVTHYFDKAQVAVIKVQKGAIQVNDLLSFEGSTGSFRQKITSLQIDHNPVKLARVGQDVGAQITQEVHEGDQVYRLEPARS